MTLFALACYDHPGGLARRMEVRERHLAYVDSFRDRLKLAGPLLDAEGAMCGSLFLIEAENEAEVEAFSAADPYRVHGVFEHVFLRRFKVTVGEAP